MTPEQNEQWRKAIIGIYGENGENWDAVLATAALLPNNHSRDQSAEFIRETIQEAEHYLTRRGVPCWATECWSYCAEQGWKDNQLWSRAFTLRGQAALIGLQILYPDRELGEPVYTRLALRWLYDAYKPLAEWVQAGKSPHDRRFAGLLEFQQLCGNEDAPDSRRWSDLYRFMRAERYKIFKREQRQLRTRASTFDKDADFCAVLHGVEAAYSLVVSDMDVWPPTDVSHEIAALYTRAPGAEALADRSNRNRTKPVADAFLAALEAECPPPDWLPRI